MDEYDKKLAQVQQHIPFLEVIIEKLQNASDSSDKNTRYLLKLEKLLAIHRILTSQQKVKIEILQQCEDIFQKIYKNINEFYRDTAATASSSKQ